MTTSPESLALSKDLKKRGWRFVGPTTMYALMQSAGIVDDHLDGCISCNLLFAELTELLEKAGIKVIQIDEPALRELLPLRADERPAYLDWAVRAFRLVALEAQPETQIHTHIGYSGLHVVVDKPFATSTRERRWSRGFRCPSRAHAATNSSPAYSPTSRAPPT